MPKLIVGGLATAIVFICGIILPMLTMLVKAFAALAREPLSLDPTHFVYQLLLFATIPISNLIIWNSLSSKDYSNPVRIGILLGVNIIVSSFYFMSACISLLNGTSTLVSWAVAGGCLLAAVVLSVRLFAVRCDGFLDLVKLSGLGSGFAVALLLFVL